MWFQDCVEVEDRSSNSQMTKVPIMMNPVQFCSANMEIIEEFLSLKFKIVFHFLTQSIFVLVFQDSIIGFRMELFMK